MSANELVDLISEKVPPSVQISALKDTYPQGVVRGDVFTIGSLDGEAGKSLKIDINPRSPYFMKGSDFNGSQGIGGIVKILMEGRGMRLPEIKELFGNYLDDTAPVEQEIPQELGVTFKRAIDVNTPFDSEHLYLSVDGEILCRVRRYKKKMIMAIQSWIVMVNQRKSLDSLQTRLTQGYQMSDLCITYQT